MSWLKRSVIFLFVMTSFMVSIKSQEIQDEAVYRIITRQGNEFIGTLVSETAEVIVLNASAFGQVNIRMEDIRRQVLISPDKYSEGEYWPDKSSIDTVFVDA